MKNKYKKLSLIIIVLIIIVLISIVYNDRGILNTKIQIMKEMTEGEYEDYIKILNKSHTDYANYIQESKANLATAITNAGVRTEPTATFETMASNISNILKNQTGGINKTEYLIKNGFINPELFSDEINTINSPTLTYERDYIFFQSYSDVGSTVTFKTPIYLKENQMVLIKYANNHTNNNQGYATIGLKKDNTAGANPTIDISTISNYSDKDIVHTSLLSGAKNKDNYLYIYSYNTRSFKIYDVAIITLNEVLEDTSLNREPLIPVVMTYNETLAANCSGATNSHRAFDGKSTTGSVANVGKYVQYKFDETVNFNEVYIQMEVPTGTTRTESIQYSVDGEEWINIVESHTFTETNNSLVVSNLNINANYIRANALSSSDSGKHTVLNFQVYKFK